MGIGSSTDAVDTLRSLGDDPSFNLDVTDNFVGEDDILMEEEHSIDSLSPFSSSKGILFEVK